MKRLLLLAFTFVLALSMTACITINVTPSQDGSSQPQQSQPADKDETSSQPDANSMPDTDVSSQPDSTPGKDDTSKPAVTPEPTPEIKETDFAMYDEWAKIVCWWNAAEGHFALPDMADSHTAIFAYGMWDTEFYKEGTVTYMYKDGEDTIVATVNFDGKEETVIIDYSGKERDGKIQMNINGEWMQYMFSGYTRDIAYRTYLDNING